MYQIENKVKNYIQEHDLLRAGDEVVVGVSGGADSMGLLYFLYKYRDFYQISLKVAHINHGIREEAENDTKHVENTCKDLNIPFFRHDCNIKEISLKEKMTEEEAGRRERYNFFISLTNSNGKIATAHNMNDQAETMLMRFLRGTDIKGLAGINPKRQQIIRPFLCLSRKEIEYYCNSSGIVYRDDHTNFLPIYTRNKIRLECIPYIEQYINPNLISLLGSHSQMYKEADDFLEGYTHRTFEQCVRSENGRFIINITKLLKEHGYIQKKVILRALAQLALTTNDITLRHIEAVRGIMGSQSGKQVNLPYRLLAIKQYDELHICKKIEKKTFPIIDLKIGAYDISEYGYKIEIMPCDRKRFEQRRENRYTKYIDYDKIRGNLQLRTRSSHDFIVLPTGTKKLKKFFTDEKVPKEDRASLPLIADGNEIVWIIGKRLSSHYYVTEETIHLLEIKFIKVHMLQEGLC